MLKSRECWSKASRVDNEEHIPYINKHKLRFVQYCYHSSCLFIKKNHFYCARLMSIDFDHGSYNRRTPAPEWMKSSQNGKIMSGVKTKP